ncbi:hypothetical protein FHS72_001436 [Loktanella ponticola]|uniref:Uncharacterized protein n=1 Tax=Yoonia ponticola TaxID=1524255 RepID=A0A7W9EXN7_9RHOB|nr:hypothetical protein [Yoonia ponticola]MBB5721824.1 hypothetical protein [Yoonia ponticola]
MITSFSKNLTLGITLAAVLFPLAASAQDGQRPAPPTAEIAAALGVSEATLATCMPRPERGERPANGERPAEGTRPARPDAAAIATCLQAENPSLTEQTVADTLKSFAPERPSR